MSTITAERRADRREERTRDAIAKTAETFRNAAARAGNSITQTEAVARVIKAREVGDAKRNS